MNLKLEFCDALCSCSEFQINGIEADKSDFGEQSDHSPKQLTTMDVVICNLRELMQHKKF
jgi:hypothetical protein